eukprot:CAMPEP_0206618224 /NCGR_PEP_ID=MMETSP0325_2-20121206/60111_1 /ASSEMBLY_ACC=CAM_ASM_000347 /TAXON_ID=2866 /ORGANISM="Crypthecodinium cohnii, Strain Seligo" /LENGTH=52 /DNA_ID=CAMNT_0054140373 /DNA_START=19 /DNA_END=175 /DNA_ORIENTATION=+
MDENTGSMPPPAFMGPSTGGIICAGMPPASSVGADAAPLQSAIAAQTVGGSP